MRDRKLLVLVCAALALSAFITIVLCLKYGVFVELPRGRGWAPN